MVRTLQLIYEVNTWRCTSSSMNCIRYNLTANCTMSTLISNFIAYYYYWCWLQVQFHLTVTVNRPFFLRSSFLSLIYSLPHCRRPSSCLAAVQRMMFRCVGPHAHYIWVSEGGWVSGEGWVLEWGQWWEQEWECLFFFYTIQDILKVEFPYEVHYGDSEAQWAARYDDGQWSAMTASHSIPSTQ